MICRSRACFSLVYVSVDNYGSAKEMTIWTILSSFALLILELLVSEHVRQEHSKLVLSGCTGHQEHCLLSHHMSC
jgi:hypothetical protein